jgi:DDE superfamily endonuclease
MEPHHETGFPATLCQWVGEIVQSSPEAARLTLLELIVGALLASGGHVTQAILALTPRLGWQAYHWMLERGRFRLLGLISALCRIVRREIGARRCFVVIDDTLAPRCSVEAPGAAVRFDHAGKTNRPKFLLCQSFVTLSAVVPCWDRPRSVPLVTGLCRSRGNAGKLALAKGLLRAVDDLGPVCLLLDAWSMRGPLIRAALRLGHDVIGQVRRDTALFRLPAPRGPGTRGRPRLYGMRIDADTAAALPASVHAIAGYGGRSARLRHAVCRPRFLRGVIVRMVWCELEKPGGGWAKARLLLSTDPALSAPAIVEDYSKRWSIEPLFRDLKTVDGLGAMWQRGRVTLLRWLHLVQIARTLLVLLTARAEPEILALVRIGGWRAAATLTPGLVKDALAARFRDFEAFRLIPETRRKSGPVRHTGPPEIAAAA